jgi:hypothetical protein
MFTDTPMHQKELLLTLAPYVSGDDVTLDRSHFCNWWRSLSITM